MFERGGGAGLCNANDEVGLNAINSINVGSTVCLCAYNMLYEHVRA